MTSELLQHIVYCNILVIAAYWLLHHISHRNTLIIVTNSFWQRTSNRNTIGPDQVLKKNSKTHSHRITLVIVPYHLLVIVPSLFLALHWLLYHISYCTILVVVPH